MPSKTHGLAQITGMDVTAKPEYAQWRALGAAQRACVLAWKNCSMVESDDFALCQGDDWGPACLIEVTSIIHGMRFPFEIWRSAQLACKPPIDAGPSLAVFKVNNEAKKFDVDCSTELFNGLLVVGPLGYAPSPRLQGALQEDQLCASRLYASARDYCFLVAPCLDAACRFVAQAIASQEECFTIWVDDDDGSGLYNFEEIHEAEDSSATMGFLRSISCAKMDMLS